ncbi:MAG: O-antigen ligase family protein [Candidatus Magasanikbacteria bacterium]|nr:O-antigen ligase family protein [Candidatus Magasanikbacteria bacterium]
MFLTAARLDLERTLRFLLKSFLFLLPWQTIWIYREVFVNGVKMEYATLGFYATEVLLWVAAGVFIIWFWRKRKLEIGNLKLKFRLTKDRVFVIACLSLITYHLSSVIWSPDKSLALQQSLHVTEAFLLFFMFMCGPLRFGKAVKWLALGAILPSLLGIWQFFSQSAFASKWLGLAEHIASNPGASVVVGNEAGRWLRAYGTFSHPNVLGGYVAVVLVLVLLQTADCGLQNKRFLFYSLITNYLLLMTAVFFSFSRSAWIAISVAVAGFVFLLYRAGERLRAFYLFSGGLLLFVVFVSLFSFMVKERLPADFQFNFSSSSEIRSIEERQAGYGEAWQIFRAHPWLGVGAGNYTLALYQLNPNRPGWEYQPAHNVGLLFLAEMGVVGAALLLFVIISFITYHISHITYQKPRVDLSRGVTCYMFHGTWYVLCVTCYLTLAFFDHYLISSYIGLVLTGIFWGLIARGAEEVVPSPSTDYPHSV